MDTKTDAPDVLSENDLKVLDNMTAREALILAFSVLTLEQRNIFFSTCDSDGNTKSRLNLGEIIDAALKNSNADLVEFYAKRWFDVGLNEDEIEAFKNAFNSLSVAEVNGLSDGALNAFTQAVSSY